MAKLGIDFSTVTASAGRMPAIPTGWQNVQIIETEHKPSSNHASTGNELIAIKVEVIDGPHAGRVLYKTFNYKNTNQQAQDIGWGEMKAVNEATGTDGEDTDDWINKPLKMYIKFKPAKKMPDAEDGTPGKEYAEGNDIDGFKSIDDTSVEVNHAVPGVSGGQTVSVAPSFNKGAGSPVPTVGKLAPGAAKPAPAAAVAKAAPKPAVPAKPAPKPVPAKPKTEKVFQMTEKAQGATEEAFQADDPDWTRELLVQEGYAEWVEVAVEVAAEETPTAAETPAVPGKKKAPWEK